MNEQTKSPEGIKIDVATLGNQLVNVSEVNINVSQQVLITTKDKVNLTLSNYLKGMESKRSWIAPLGIFTTILVTLSTTTFKNVGLNAEIWRDIFIFVAGVALLWLVLSINEARKSKKIEDFYEELKKESH